MASCNNLYSNIHSGLKLVSTTNRSTPCCLQCLTLLVRHQEDHPAHSVRSEVKLFAYGSANANAIPNPIHDRWRHGLVVSGVRRMNEINAHWDTLVPGWVTVFGRVYYLGM